MLTRRTCTAVGWWAPSKPTSGDLSVACLAVQDFVTYLKKSAFVIDGGIAGKRIRVPLTLVRSSSFAKQYEPHLIAASFIVVSLPWSCFAVVAPYRYISLATATFSLLRVGIGRGEVVV